jgi:peptidoglycan/xylan/chitin deacetylase (PgdA/CDA1 family)
LTGSHSFYRLGEEKVDFVDLDEAGRRLCCGNPRSFACFTFDDGYAGNLTRALPIMERFCAPFMAYVTTGMVTGEIDAWWFGLAGLVGSRDRMELTPRLRFECPDPFRKRIAVFTKKRK